jgi:hypothetical protein
MVILIENTTDSELTVALFPKPDYLDGSTYRYSELGNGDYSSTTKTVEPSNDKIIYISTNLNQEPHYLVSKVFDSIYITSNELNLEMKFYPDTVIGYSENLYKPGSSWNYQKWNYSEKTNLSTHPIESHEYGFVISTK